MGCGGRWSCRDPAVTEMQTMMSRCFTPARTQGPLPQRTLYMVGDSHTSAMAPGVMAAVEGALDMAWVASGSGCGFLSESNIDVIFHLDGEEGRQNMHKGQICVAFNQAILRALEEQLQPCDVVLIHQISGKMVLPQLEYLQQLQQMVIGKGASLVLLGDTVTMPRAGKYCINVPQVCEVRQKLQAARKEEQVYSQLAQVDGTYYLPLYDLMCAADGTCGAFVPGTTTLAYWDYSHVTLAAALYVWPFICTFFRENGLLGDQASG